MKRIVFVVAVTVTLAGWSASANGVTCPTASVVVPSRTMVPRAALQELRVALRAWARFPVTASPRPLVLSADPVSAPEFGFRTDDAKEAFLSGAFIAPDALPSGPRHVAGYPVVTAAQALAVMR